MNRFLKIVVTIVISAVIWGCGSDSGNGNPEPVSQQDIIENYSIEKLSRDIFYFKAQEPQEGSSYIQPLERFDLIFVGYNEGRTDDTNLISHAIPGTYTHMLAYIGKDSDGFAYAIEMNVDANLSYSVEISGLKVGGHAYVYCIGSDFDLQPCPVDDHFFGLEMYDYKVAKRLDEPLRAELLKHEKALLATMKEDLQSQLPFQLPLNVGLETMINKTVGLVDDGRINGADCTSYFTGLFEEVAGVCLDDVRINAATLRDYYVNTPEGQLAKLPERFNFISEGDIYFSDLLENEGYALIDNTARQTHCSDGRIVQGIPIPDKVFHSGSMVEIAPYGSE